MIKTFPAIYLSYFYIKGKKRNYNSKSFHRFARVCLLQTFFRKNIGTSETKRKNFSVDTFLVSFDKTVERVEDVLCFVLKHRVAISLH